MGKKFSVMDLMNNKSKDHVQDKEQYEHIKLKLDEIIPSEQNFYSMGEIEELGKSILLVGLQQPIVLAKINNTYKVISGHRRRAALKWLVGQGYVQFEEVDCMYTEMTETMFNLSLIVGNAFSRKMTDYDLMMQEKKLKEALIKAKEAGEIEIKGKLRDCIAELLDLSRTKVAQIEAINNNLSEEAKEEIMKGQISFTNAYEMSKLSQEQQNEVVNQAKSEEVKGKDIKQMIEEKKSEQKKEQSEQETVLVHKEPACKEQLAQVVKVSETDTIIRNDGEVKGDDLVQEHKIVDVLEELIECYQLISSNECLIISDILKNCNERVGRKK